MKKILSLAFIGVFIISGLGAGLFQSEDTDLSLTSTVAGSLNVRRGATTRSSEQHLGTTSLLRITAAQSAFVPSNADVIGGKPGKWLDILVPGHQYADFEMLREKSTVLIEDVAAHSAAVAADYHSLAEAEQVLADISHQYPNITTLYSIGKTYEGRDIWCLEITDNPGIDEGEPGVCYMGLHHAREWPSLEICLHIAQELTSRSSINASIRDLVNSRRVWVIPCVNPDGYYYSHDLGNDWRKNRHYFPEFDTYGVDLNRNYAGSCNGDAWGTWGSLGRASLTHNPSYSTYCGPLPFSELEAQAIRDLFLENDVSACITWHTYGELVLWPWSYSEHLQTPDDAYIAQVGQDIAHSISTMSGNGTYTPVQGSGLYPTAGDTVDWAYGYSHYVLGTTTFPFTIEACSEFHPPAVHLEQVISENFDGALVLLKEAENISRVTPRAMPPRIRNMTSDPDGTYTVFWEERNPDAHASIFQLEELAGLSFIIDHAFPEEELWVYDGFSVTTQQYHSAGSSYRARNEDNDVSSMTTRYPVPIREGMTLSFWCWYDIEENWDFGFVELSHDGRLYTPIDTFTGASHRWEYREYNLADWVDTSVYIRFRYTTEQRTTGTGFFIDDISPVATFTSVTSLSDSIDGTYYDVVDNQEGLYCYRVRAFNDARGWGDYSTLATIHVTETNNTPPETPFVDGPQNGEIEQIYEYTFVTSDAENDELLYYVDWGDGNGIWLGPHLSGDEVAVSHTWTEKGSYDVSVKAQDSHGLQSSWGTLRVSMPKTYENPLRELIVKLFDLFEHLFGRVITLGIFDL